MSLFHLEATESLTVGKTLEDFTVQSHSISHGPCVEFLHVFSCVYLCHSTLAVPSMHVPGMCKVRFLKP
jgi:hypothetical protein